MRRIIGHLLDHAFDVLPFLLVAAVVGSHGSYITITV
jgi:hypothetical protein